MISPSDHQVQIWGPVIPEPGQKSTGVPMYSSVFYSFPFLAPSFPKLAQTQNLVAVKPISIHGDG